jgi:Protein of unknown function (DUF3667)
MPDELTDRAEGSPLCLNCGEKLLGKYCWRCGQEAADLHRPFRELFSGLVDDVFSLDTRLLRTLVPLFFRPGLLTREYLAGRRARYVRPLKIYLIAALVFFGVVALLPKENVHVVRGQESPAAIPEGGSRLTFKVPERFPLFDRPLQEASARAREHPQEFADAFFDNLPRVFFLLLPAFALLLKLFYWRQDRYYVDHLIFALHYYAFVFLDTVLLLLLGRSWAPDLLAWVLMPILGLGLVLYLPLALRRVYGGSWWMTVLKLLALAVTYTFVFGFGMLLVISVTLAFF